VIAYLDSSVILRILLDQPHQLAEWKSILTGVTSALTEVECLRTIDRLRVLGKLGADGADDAVVRREAVYRVLEELEVVDLDARVLRRAAQAQTVALGSLDALHLASAEMWREAQGKEPLFATHDRQLGQAARANGFRIAGV
jgi:predicted nucleic acid-binding protein